MSDTRLPLGDSRHGINGYSNVGCRCELCRDAQRRRVTSQRDERRAALAADPTLVEHGRASTYQNWRCRCDKCTAAAADYRKTLRAK